MKKFENLTIDQVIEKIGTEIGTKIEGKFKEHIIDEIFKGFNGDECLEFDIMSLINVYVESNILEAENDEEEKFKIIIKNL